MNPGYVIIDGTGIDLNDLGEVEGIYTKVKNAVDTGKPMFLGGVVNDTQAFSPMPCYGGAESSSSVFLSFFPVTLHISSADVVSL